MTAMLSGSCDYPEQGCYELAALDGFGLPVASWPLMVEELVDDTDMTYAFNVLLPVEGELLELPLTNVEMEQARAWELRLSQADYGLGDLDLTLKHAAERLGFIGAYRTPPPADDTPERPAMATTRPEDNEEATDDRPGYPFAGFIQSDQATGVAALTFNGELPPLSADLAGAVTFELRPITPEQFEQALGGSVDDALRRLATPRETLSVSDEPPPAEELAAPEPAEDDTGDEQTAPDRPEKPEKQPPLGGRGGSRPR
ncbi:hypothetical protein JW859_05275 [bacterium]|nr:hypothetical protein [bacterium]